MHKAVVEPLLKTDTVRAAPYSMIRVAGMPYDDLQAMRALRTMDALRSVTEHKQWFEEHTEQIVESIEKAVPSLLDDGVRNKLIAYKRHMFNRKFPKQQADFFEGHLPGGLLDRMRMWESRFLAVRELETLAAGHYEQELERGREQLQASIRNKDFLNGVALTSRDLYTKMLTYIDTPIAEQNARLRRIEYSLATFVSRVAGKTSPFATFTSVGMAKLSNEPGEASLTLDSLEMKSKIRLNHCNVLRIVDGISKHPDVRPLLSYRLNTTMKITGPKVSLIRRNDSPKSRPKVFRTLESPIQLDYNPSIHLVVSQFDGLDKAQALPYEELLDRLVAAANASREQFASFVQRLIDVQILEPEITLYDQTLHILRDTIEWTAQFPVEIARQTIERLQDIERLLVEYEQAPTQERLELQVQLRGVFAAIYDSLGITDYEQALTLIVYEDGILPGVGELKGSVWQEFVDDLAAYQKIAPLFDEKFRIQSVYAHEFKQMYGEDGVCENTFEFLNQMIPRFTEFFEAMTPGDILADLKIRNDVEVVRQLNDLKREFGTLVGERMSVEQDEVVLTRADLDQFSSRLPDGIKGRLLSHDFMVQWGRANGEDMLVLNQAYHGYSTFYSRFLDYYGEECIEAFRDYLKDLFDGQGGVLAEISNAYGFNGSLHPKLTPYELKMPMLDPSRNVPAEEEVDWRDLKLVYDKQTERVVLHHDLHGKVNPLSLGTLVPMMMPFISNFLWNMFNNSSMPIQFYNFCEEHFTEEEFAKIRTYPRLRVGNVVVARKRWLIARPHLPEKGTKEEEFDFFYRVHEWRTAAGLPSRVFIRCMPTTPAEKALLNSKVRPGEGEERGNLDFTSMKPQYIDFENPMLVRLFGKMVLDSEYGMSVEEMLPDEEALTLQDAGKRYVSEFLIEMSQTDRRS